MPTVWILEEAEQEVAEAAAWYEARLPGLGGKFYEAIESAIDVMEEGIMPLLPMPDTAGLQGAKRIILKEFPYDIVTIERSNGLLIIAFSHHSRKPGYWKERVYSNK